MFNSSMHSQEPMERFRLIHIATELMQFFEHFTEDQARHYADLFYDLSQDNNDAGIELDEWVKTEFREFSEDLNWLLEQQAFSHGDYCFQDDPHHFESSFMQEEQKKRKRDAKFIIAPFDAEFYLQQSRENLFVQANIAYTDRDYKKALELFEAADRYDNIYAAAHIGMMYHNGYGCDPDDKKNLEYLRKGARNGCPLAGACLAECFRLGVETDKDYAMTLYTRAKDDLYHMCSAGDATAMYCLGFNLARDIFEENKRTEGINLLKLAHSQGYWDATVQLAECYYFGYGVEKDYKEAFRLLHDNPVPETHVTHYILVRCYASGEGTEQDLKKAFFHCKKSAELGNELAKTVLGCHYQHGIGTEINYTLAEKWYKDAADNHRNGYAAYQLAKLYWNGPLQKDRSVAAQYFLKAAQNGNADAQYFVAQLYVRDEIFEQDFEAARMWMEKAAAQGMADAQDQLGAYYACDFGFQDDKKAFEWFMKAAEQGHREGAYHVGGCYHIGIGVAADRAKAIEWYARAADRGHMKASLELSKLLIEDHTRLEEAFKMLQEIDSEDQELFAEAQFWLSECLLNGYGCAKNKKLAKQHYTAATENGYVDTRTRKKFLGIF